jgi:hypothetical protein
MEPEPLHPFLDGVLAAPTVAVIFLEHLGSDTRGLFRLLNKAAESMVRKPSDYHIDWSGTSFDRDLLPAHVCGFTSGVSLQYQADDVC